MAHSEGLPCMLAVIIWLLDPVPSDEFLDEFFPFFLPSGSLW